MKIEGQTVNFMVNMRAEHSVFTQKIALFSGWEVTIIGATKTQTHWPFCSPHWCWLGGHQVVHEFLFLPDYQVPLMDRDFLAKMRAEMAFTRDGSAQMHLNKKATPIILSLAMPQEEEWRL